jgi:hypothetical protein
MISQRHGGGDFRDLLLRRRLRPREGVEDGLGKVGALHHFAKIE